LTSWRKSKASSSSSPRWVALGVQRRAQEVGVADAGDLHRILEGEEQALAGALLRGLLDQVLTEILDGTFTDVVVLASGQHRRQGALARAVGAHDGVDLAGVDGQIDALEDLVALNGGMKIGQFEHVLPSVLPSADAALCVRLVSWIQDERPERMRCAVGSEFRCLRKTEAYPWVRRVFSLAL
jgi:hypothetical protein